MAIKRKECAKCKRNRALKFFKGDRGTVCASCKRKQSRDFARGTHLMKTYFITLEEYNELLAVQNGRCAVCNGYRSTSYDVDHDHKMEKQLRSAGWTEAKAMRGSIRGLLCRRCNRRLLPAAVDNPDILHAAVSYLESPPAHGVIK